MPTITLSEGSRLELPSPETLARGNTDTPGVWRFDAPRPGPSLAITALIHGNEVCGAHALWPLLRQAPRLGRGQLTLAFCNLDAYGALDDASKGECRLADEDMNRVWGRLDTTSGASPSRELARARVLRPWVAQADFLLDLHSMSTAAPPLGLVAMADKNIEFARRLGSPALLLRDAGHAAGLRLIDSGAFADPQSPQSCMLVECGEHFSASAMATAVEVVRRALRILEDDQATPGAPTDPAQQLIAVSEAVTIRTEDFRWVQEWSNMALVPQAGTLVGWDGGTPVRTPHDAAYMVMPATQRFRKPGQTAVRFGRRIA